MDFKIKIPKTAVPWLVGAGVVTGGAVIGVVTLMNRSDPPSPVVENSIVLSILDEISIVKGERKQDVLILNPSDNSYDLMITMMDESGKILYQSDRMQPGTSASSITFSRVFREDETTVTVSYDCYEGEEIVESIQVETDLLQQ